MEVGDDQPTRRLWLIFFAEARRRTWWAPFLRRGFRHVSAAAWFSDQERWVHVAPVGGGLVVEVMRTDEFAGRFGELVGHSTVVLRFAARHERTGMPLIGFCTGTIVALLGIRGRALSPYGLYRHLLAHGAEIVATPEVVRCDGAVQQTPKATGRGPCS